MNYAKSLAPLIAPLVKQGINAYMKQGNKNRKKKRKSNNNKGKGKLPLGALTTRAAVPMSFGTTIGPAPIAVNTQKPRRQKGMVNTGPSTVCIKGRQWVSGVSSKNNETQHYSFLLNPSNSNAFGWLAGIAPKYDKYRVKRFGFQYVPTCATNTNCEVMCVYNPDAAEVATGGANSKMEAMRDNAYAFQSSSWMGINKEIPPQDLQIYKWLRTRSGVNGDLDDSSANNIYDFGTFHFFSVSAATISLGDIYFLYEFEFRDRQNETEKAGWWIFGREQDDGALADEAMTIPRYYGKNSMFVRHNTHSLRALYGGQSLLTIRLVGTNLSGCTVNVTDATAYTSTVNDITLTVNAAGTELVKVCSLSVNSGDIVTIKATCDTCTYTCIHGTAPHGRGYILDPDDDVGDGYDLYGEEI